jgi:hypothetical protein
VAKKRIFTVGFSLPGEEFEYIEFGSNRTLLDADIVLLEPSLNGLSNEYNVRDGGDALYAGVPMLTERSSFVAKSQVDHWRSEIIEAVNAGKLVIVYLATPVQRYRYTGEKKFTGTGKSLVGRPIVEPISSYDVIPIIKKVAAKAGTAVRLEKEAAYLRPYWEEFSKFSSYEVEIDGEFNRVLLKSLSGDRVVGAAVHGKVGALLFLPPLRYDEEKFLREAKEGEEEDEMYWTSERMYSCYGQRR